MQERLSAEGSGRFPCPSKAYLEAKQAQQVARWADISVPEARALPEPEFLLYLRCSSAENQAEPVRLEHQKQVAERRAEEDKERREAMDY